MARTTTFYEISPRSGRPRYTWIGVSWSGIVDDLAHFYECRDDEIRLEEIYWGGEYGDDERAEVILVRGELVGSLDELLDADALTYVRATLDNIAEIERRRA